MQIQGINPYISAQYFQGKKEAKTPRALDNQTAINDMIDAVPISDDNKKMLNYYLFFDDKRAKSIKALLAFVSGKIINPEILSSGQCASSIDKKAQEDIDKLVELYQKDKDAEETFVPSYKDENDALYKSKTGDVVQIKDKRNIHIKTKEGKLRELFITPKTYLELFPPVERYAVQQGYLGDCFVLSTLDSLYSNPSSRERILECFSEDNKGNVSACLSGYERDGNKTRRKDKKRYYFANASAVFEHETRKTSFGADGFRILEMLIRREKEAQARKTINSQLIKFSKLKEEIGDSPCIEYEGENYYKQEIENFFKLEQDAFDNPDDEEKQLFSFADSFETLQCSMEDEDEIDDEDEYEEETGIFENYMDAVSDRIIDYCKANNLSEIPVECILPAHGIKDLTGVDFNYHDIYISNGGYPRQIFDIFGIENKDYDTKTKKDELYRVLTSKDFNSNYVMAAYTPEFSDEALYSKEYKFSEHHAYSVSPFLDKNGDLKLSVRNPHNSLFVSEIDFDEFCDLFEVAAIGKV